MAVYKIRGEGGRPAARRVLVRVTIRPARFGDAVRIAEMANDLALRTTGKRGRMTPASVRRDLVGQTDLGCIVAERAGTVVGYALWSAAYETAFAARGLYLSDLYVEGGHRGQGIGRSLMQELARLCSADGGRFLWWVVTPDNAAAQSFYDGLGAVTDPVSARAVFEAPYEALLKG